MPQLIREILDFGVDGREMWYRGHKFHDYYLEPSAYRYRPFMMNSRAIEVGSIMAAKSEMLHVIETHNLTEDLNWLCYLQHNRLPTRLLDWTFEFQVALYFAFEDYLQNKAIPGSLPCLWAFRPGEFMDGIAKYITDRNRRDPLGIRSNRTAEVAKEIFADKQPKDATFISNFDIRNVELLDDVYVPFFSPFVNERAKLQGGCFIRFPLLDQKQLPQHFIDHRLENFVGTDPCFANCLVKFVFVHPTKMKDELSILNLKTSRIYPEVENLALAIKKRFFEP
jgi:hypothetical protein